MVEALRRSQLRQYAEDRSQLQRLARRLQESLIIEVERRQYQRYRADVRREELDVPYTEWLLQKMTLHDTFEERSFSYRQRLFWAHTIVTESRRLTLGKPDNSWFLSGLKDQINARAGDNDPHAGIGEQSISVGPHDPIKGWFMRDTLRYIELSR